MLEEKNIIVCYKKEVSNFNEMVKDRTNLIFSNLSFNIKKMIVLFYNRDFKQIQNNYVKILFDNILIKKGQIIIENSNFFEFPDHVSVENFVCDFMIDIRARYNFVPDIISYSKQFGFDCNHTRFEYFMSNIFIFNNANSFFNIFSRVKFRRIKTQIYNFSVLVLKLSENLDFEKVDDEFLKGLDIFKKKVKDNNLNSTVHKKYFQIIESYLNNFKFNEIEIKKLHGIVMLYKIFDIFNEKIKNDKYLHNNFAYEKITYILMMLDDYINSSYNFIGEFIDESDYIDEKDLLAVKNSDEYKKFLQSSS